MEGVCKGKKSHIFLFIGVTVLLLIANNNFEMHLFFVYSVYFYLQIMKKIFSPEGFICVIYHDTIMTEG